MLSFEKMGVASTSVTLDLFSSDPQNKKQNLETTLNCIMYNLYFANKRILPNLQIVFCWTVC